MFLFVGFVLAFVQGSYVRRRSAAIGPQRMAIHGLIITAPGLMLLGSAHTTAMLYAGLFFMAVGSAQVIPCLTALASLYAPANEQGRVLGVFRSLGALARGVGRRPEKECEGQAQTTNFRISWHGRLRC